MCFNNVYSLTFTHFLASLVEVSILFRNDNTSLSVLGITAKAKRDDIVEECDH